MSESTQNTNKTTTKIGGINFTVRFKNKVWLTAFAGAIIIFVYNMAGMFGIELPTEQPVVEETVATIISLLVMIGVVQDPTTKGVKDSEKALEYTTPGGEDKAE